MTDDEIQKLKEENETLKKQLEEAKTDNSFDELKAKFDKALEEKNNEITELTKTNKALQEKMDSTISNLDGEVQTKLAMADKLDEMNKTIEELMTDKAEATVDTFIQQGKILPAQRETALKLCLNDNDTFLDLYKNAKPIVEIQQERRSIPTGTAERIANYFKN